MIHYISAIGIGSPWVAAELEIIARSGIPVCLHTIRRPGKHFFGSEDIKRIDRESRVLYPMPLLRSAGNVLLAPFRYRGRFFSALLNALLGERESPRARVAGILHLFVACHWVAELPRGKVSLIHSQWIHSCGTIGMYGAWLLDVPFSFTGHAVDLFRDRVALRDKVRRAEFIVCISNFHRELYRTLGASEDKLHTIFCGIDVDALAFRPRSREAGPATILSLGRLIEKKGFEYLIDACAILRERGIKHRCIIGGDGPLEASLRQRISDRGVEDSVELSGRAVLQEDLPEFFASGHMFAQPCVWAKDGDVDGTPRTLMEAMACGNVAISTKLVGIPDIVEDGVSGLLVEPNNATALADALQRVIEDAELTSRLAVAGRRRMEELFRIEDCVGKLAELFKERLKRSGTEIGVAVGEAA